MVEWEQLTEMADNSLAWKVALGMLAFLNDGSHSSQPGSPCLSLRLTRVERAERTTLVGTFTTKTGSNEKIMNKQFQDVVSRTWTLYRVSFAVEPVDAAVRPVTAPLIFLALAQVTSEAVTLVDRRHDTAVSTETPTLDNVEYLRRSTEFRQDEACADKDVADGLCVCSIQ